MSEFQRLTLVQKEQFLRLIGKELNLDTWIIPDSMIGFEEFEGEDNA